MKVTSCLIIALSMCMNVPAQKFVANYDEAKIPAYTLPDPLEGISSAADWPTRREAIRRLIAKEMFGHVPSHTATLEIVPDTEPFKILDGKAIVSQPAIKIAGTTWDLMIIRPANPSSPPPAFIAYNFGGNHTVIPDRGVRLPVSWQRKAKNHKAQEADRGSSARRWDVAALMEAGYALVTLYYGDVDPDMNDGFRDGVHAHFGVPKSDEWGSIATWAWGLSKTLDYLVASKIVDAERVSVLGHSRLGKTSLWAGANDERFALVISNNSGCGGAALSKRAIGETVGRINTSFPHWFNGNFKKYNRNESAMPFDSHMLLALIAPRPLYVASAEQDRWADPHGEFLACVGADPVYRLLGTEGLPSRKMPKLNEPTVGRIGYHIRSGKHDVTAYDWAQYIAFANKHLN